MDGLSWWRVESRKLKQMWNAASASDGLVSSSCQSVAGLTLGRVGVLALGPGLGGGVARGACFGSGRSEASVAHTSVNAATAPAYT